MNSIVGAGIVEIITESLYDKPIVVFREYVQNSADAFSSMCETEMSELEINIINADNNLYFIDNGTGINEENFQNKMISIANSQKTRTKNIGYKGIGRLSGLSYCKNLWFVNILDYKNKKYQIYKIDGQKYSDIKKSETFGELSFSALMSDIGSIESTVDEGIECTLNQHGSMFASRNTGFLVMLDGITPILKKTLGEENFLNDLGWLLPVPFYDNLDDRGIFDKVGTNKVFENGTIPAKSYHVFYDNTQIFRPLKKEMIRTYLCKCDLESYATCIHSFSNQKIEMMKTNPFSGIRIYLDNVLLCDENELIPALQQYGFINHGLYEMIQAVRGIGAFIYIVDKVNISANARRTFIDVTDDDAIQFMRLVAEFIEIVYNARYALSKYSNAKKKAEISTEKLGDLKEKAQRSLEALAQNEIVIEDEIVQPTDFNNLSRPEQQRIVRDKLSKSIREYQNKFINQSESFNIDSCVEDFKTWLSVN